MKKIQYGIQSFLYPESCQSAFIDIKSFENGYKKSPQNVGIFLFNQYFLTSHYLPPKTYDTPTRPPTSLPPAKPTAALTEVRPSANTLATPKAPADSPS